MINVLTLSSEIVNIAGKTGDIPTMRRVQLAIQNYITRFTRDTITSNKYVSSSFIVNVQKEIEKLTNDSNYYIDDNIRSFKTIKPIPNNVRLFSNSPFLKLSSQSGTITFAYTDDINDVRFEKGGSFTNGNRYLFENGTIYLYTLDPLMTSFKYVKVSYVPENPLLVVDDIKGQLYSLENYPASSDIVSIIKVEILKNLFPNIPKNNIEEIKIDG
jgi:hypothetical protein